VLENLPDYGHSALSSFLLAVGPALTLAADHHVQLPGASQVERIYQSTLALL